MQVVYVVLFVVLVNAGCICSFSRAERALRDLGAAWVRALLTARDRDEPPREERPGPRVRVRTERRRAVALRPLADR